MQQKQDTDQLRIIITNEFDNMKCSCNYVSATT